MFASLTAFVTAIAAGRFDREVVDGSHELDYEAEQLVILMRRPDDAAVRVLREVLGDVGWRVHADGAGADEDSGPSEQFVGAYYNSEVIGDNIQDLADLAQDLQLLVANAGVGEIDGLCDEDEEQAIFAYGPTPRLCSR